jgi:phosphoglycolate phosphatase
MTAAPRFSAALFDLDGTLLDTALDLAAACNRMLAALDRPALPVATVATFVGKGTTRLVERCLAATAAGGTPDPAVRSRALDLFGTAYAEESGRQATLYPGVLAGLDAFAHAGFRLACVTNKPARFTEPLLAATGLAGRFDLVVSGDTVARAKPDPMPVLHACARLAVAPAASVMIGDSENDAVAGRAAGCRVLCVTYGYTEGVPVTALPCDGLVASLAEAADVVARWNAG